MGYRINVAKAVEITGSATIGTTTRYSHLFATDPETLKDARIAAKILAILQKTFPSPEYDVSISERQESGKELNPKKFLKEYYSEAHKNI
jgi:hypothetical protein